MSKISIFQEFYSEERFVDRLEDKGEAGVDVIIPLLNTNELWKKNLYSFYREIPINSLLIGDGGCTDDSIEVVLKFPRVKILKQGHLKTLGYRIQRLIESVETDWFIYLHGDVYLPKNWYDEMRKHQKDYDWFECYPRNTVLIEFIQEAVYKAERAYSGSQMGRTAAFRNIGPKIDDDFLYRNEDIVFAELIESEGFRYGKVSDTYYYHEVMNTKGETEPKFKYVKLQKEHDKEWEINTYTMQAKGIIKYLQPKNYLVIQVNSAIDILLKYDALNWGELKQWVKETNPVWLKYVSRSKRFYLKISAGITYLSRGVNYLLNKE